jgi:aryl-alcohol dehydrogenase-like predicted oxidoreductase
LELKYRRLGKSDIKVSEIGFGAWTIGLDWWGKKIEDDEAISMLKRPLTRVSISLILEICTGREKVKS